MQLLASPSSHHRNPKQDPETHHQSRTSTNADRQKASGPLLIASSKATAGYCCLQKERAAQLKTLANLAIDSHHASQLRPVAVMLQRTAKQGLFSEIVRTLRLEGDHEWSHYDCFCWQIEFQPFPLDPGRWRNYLHICSGLWLDSG